MGGVGVYVGGGRDVGGVWDGGCVGWGVEGVCAWGGGVCRYGVGVWGWGCGLCGMGVCVGWGVWGGGIVGFCWVLLYLFRAKGFS